MNRFTIYTILLCFMTLPKIAFGGNLDTIVKIEGKKLPVHVIKVNPQDVRYIAPGDDQLSTILRKDIFKIIYSNGNIETYNTPSNSNQAVKPQTPVKTVNLDTIIKVEGKILPVNVVKITEQYVRFMVPGNSEVFTLSRKDIHKIIYASGRIEDYNALAVNMIDENAWQAVWITENKEEVESLYKRGEIKSQSPPSSRSPAAAKKNAIIRLQKKAALMKGTVVFVTDKKTTGGYGELPGYYIQGVVYGTEPLEEGEAPKQDFDVIQ